MGDTTRRMRIPLGTAVVIWRGCRYVGKAAVDEWVQRRDARRFRESLDLQNAEIPNVTRIRSTING